jgi:spermidine synthase
LFPRCLKRKRVHVTIEPPPRADSPALPPLLPLILALFVGSGCAALIYEIVWFQLLQLVIGSSAVSLGVLLGTFMGGMCLGSLLLPRLLSPRLHPLRVYAVLEMLIGVIGVAVLFGMPWLGQFYTEHASSDSSSVFMRGLVCAICLLPPTLLMGATLPAIARWVHSTPAGVSWLGFFYGGNIVGAVLGCLLAGFYLLRVYDMWTATGVAVTINFVVAASGFALSALFPRQSPAAEVTPPAAEPLNLTPPARSAYLAIAISGMTALAAEVVWTRHLSLMLGATVYTFSIILAVFLVGLGIGSAVGSVLVRYRVDARSALGWCQLLLAGTIAWTAFALARSLPYWPIDPTRSMSPWFGFQLDLLRTAWAVLPAACLWGASFPLAVAAAATPEVDPGKLVGGIYAANTIGAIIGALASSLWLIGLVGTRQVERYMIACSLAAAALMLGPSLVRLWMRQTGGQPSVQANATNAMIARLRQILTTIAVLAGVSLAGWLAWTVPQIPWELVAYGRSLIDPSQHKLQFADNGEIHDTNAKLMYLGEGRNSSVAVTELPSGVRNFHVSGKVEASTEPQDMRLQRMLGHIPAMLHAKPESVLIVGCGAGVTAGSFIVYPEVKRIVICEIEPLIPSKVTPYFAAQNYDVVNNPRVEIHYDDARHYLLTTKEKFDIITSDPIHPWVKGAATLYTDEYFHLVRDHLNPGGMVTQWVPLYESTPAVVKSEMATFFDVFPHGTIWSNDFNGEGYDTVVLGEAGDQPLRIDVEELKASWERPDHEEVAHSLREVGFHTPLDMLATYAGRATDLKNWLADAQINRDRNLRLQYLAGMGLNEADGGIILNQILFYFNYPDDLFISSPEFRTQLDQAMQRPAPQF